MWDRKKRYEGNFFSRFWRRNSVGESNQASKEGEEYEEPRFRSPRRSSGFQLPSIKLQAEFEALLKESEYLTNDYLSLMERFEKEVVKSTLLSREIMDARHDLEKRLTEHLDNMGTPLWISMSELLKRPIPSHVGMISFPRMSIDDFHEVIKGFYADVPSKELGNYLAFLGLTDGEQLTDSEEIVEKIKTSLVTICVLADMANVTLSEIIEDMTRTENLP